MLSLAVIPGNSMDDLAEKGVLARLSSYYNPERFFDRVVVFSPFEESVREVAGMQIVPTKDHQLPSRLGSYKIDLVRAYGGGTPADMAVFYRAARVPVIVSIHDKRASMIHEGVTCADVVFVVSQELREILVSRGVAPSRIMVVPNGVDDVLMRPLPPESFSDLGLKYPFKYKLLHVGRKSPEKNIEAIIHALVQLGEDYGLVAVGQGDAAFYEALALAQGVSDRCIFLPGVSQEELVRFYNWADCVCHPSRSEAMCNVLLEALACGRAVVSTVTAATGVGDGPMSAMRLLADPEDVGLLAQMLRSLCEDAREREALCSRARKSVEHLFLFKTQAHEVACYRQVLSMGNQGAFKRGWRDDACLCGINAVRRLRRLLRVA
ncbi:MAG: glycosyltransferase family 4 protein [Candidatus Omnitrophota bacterium]